MEAPIRVVHVDDDPDVRSFIDFRLRADPGIQILATGQNGREALQLANRHRPDVMILDIDMPVMSGLEAGARIATAFPSIGIVYLTSHESLENIKTAYLKAKAIAYLNKRLEMPQIATAVRQAAALRDRDSSGQGLGTCWTFYGPQGRAGTTSLAINAALELGGLGYRVLLVDLGFMHGGCSFHLRLEREARGPNLFLDLPTLETIDAESLRPYQKRIPPAPGYPELHVVFSPGTFVPDTTELADRLRQCLEVWETSFDYIVLDVPSGQLFSEVNVLSLEFSERVFLVNHADLCGLKALWDFVKLQREVSFSANRLTLLFSSLVGAQRAKYTPWLADRGIQSGAVRDVPVDHALALKALARGAPMLHEGPDSEYARFLRDMVTQSLNFAPADKPAAGMFSRFRRLIMG